MQTAVCNLDLCLAVAEKVLECSSPNGMKWVYAGLEINDILLLGNNQDKILNESNIFCVIIIE